MYHWACRSSRRRKLSAKNAKVVRPTLFNYIFTRDEFENYSNALWKMMTEKKFSVRIHDIYPLENVAKAHTVRLKYDCFRSSLTLR